MRLVFLMILGHPVCIYELYLRQERIPAYPLCCCFILGSPCDLSIVFNKPGIYTDVKYGVS